MYRVFKSKYCHQKHSFFFLQFLIANLYIAPVFALPNDAGNMIYIPPGELWLGEYEGLGIEPVWRVEVHSFYFDKYEVSNAEYSAFVNATGRSTVPDAGPWFNHPDHPAVASWYDARDFCSWAGKRLPREAEWERAAEGDDGRRFPWSDDIIFEVFNSSDGRGGDGTVDGYIFTNPIDAFPAGVSAFGAYNMAGNVWEWNADWFEKDYLDVLPSHLNGPASGVQRVMRGGAWDTSTNFTRTSRRGRLEPAFWYADVGFRCAADTLPELTPLEKAALTDPPIIPSASSITTSFAPILEAIQPHTPIKAFLGGPNYEIGPGVALGDYDNDGKADLFVTNTTYNSLYHNSSSPGNIALKERTQSAGLLDLGEEWTGAVFADYDNDGFKDLYVGNFFGANALYHNQGDGTFTNRTLAAGVEDTLGTTAGIAFGDYDNDGDLDLMVANYFRNFFTPESVENSFFRNNGDGTFNETTQEIGLVYTAGRSFQPLFFDYDKNGTLDLYVVNDFGPNELYKNLNNGHFEDVSILSKSNDEGHGMGGTLGDYDGDGDLDIYITNFGYNSLLKNEADGTFTNVAKEKRVDDIYVGWGTDFIDYDNDGDLDLFAVNGGLDWNIRLERYSYAPNIFYQNEGTGPFSDITDQLELGDTFGARGMAIGDLDDDGFSDMIVLNIDYQPIIYHNTGNENHWLKIRPLGLKSNRHAVGAQVRITTGGKTQYQEVLCGNSYLSQSSTDLDFGLGVASSVDVVEIFWPASNTLDRLYDVPANQLIEITEGSSPVNTAIFEANINTPAAFDLKQNFPNPFNAQTQIPFHIDGPANGTPVELDIFNNLGQKLRTLVDHRLLPGNYQLTWDGLNDKGQPLPSGVYFYRLNTLNQEITRSLVLLQ